MKLIMNADDFGLTTEVNRAIIKCMEHGVVKATTLMVNQPGTADAINLIKQGKVCGDVGLHLTLTSGRPILPAHAVPDLVDEDGYFLSNPVLTKKKTINLEQVYNELSAQHQHAIESGVKLSHLDCHHFAATLPQVKPAYIDFANNVGLPSRRADVFEPGQSDLHVPTPDALDITFYDNGATFVHLQTLLLQHKTDFPHGILEVMCHPGSFNDASINAISSYTTQRCKETQILTSVELSNWLEKYDIECIGFSQL